MSSAACCGCVGIRAFSFSHLPDPDPSAASSASPQLLPTRCVSLPEPMLFCDGYLRLGGVKALFSSPAPFKNNWVATVTDYTLKGWYLHSHPVWTQVTPGYRFSFICPILTSLKPIWLCYLHLQVKVDIFTLTSVSLVCIFLKTFLVFYIDSGGSVTVPALHCPNRDYSKNHSNSVWVWVGSYVRGVKIPLLLSAGHWRQAVSL